MKRFSLFLLTLISAIVCILPAEARGEIISTRQAKHLLMPYLGYQALENEKMDFTYHAIFRYYFAGVDTTFFVDSTLNQERNIKAPMFGLMYSFRPNHMINLDVAAAMIHDGKSYNYQVEIPIFDYSSVYDLYLIRGNTYFGCIDAGYNLPIPVKWFTMTLRGGGGYAWRKVKVRNDYESSDSQEDDYGLIISIIQRNADALYVTRGGLDLTLWRKNQMIITGSLFYTYYTPTDSEIDPFGGIGWRMSFFPVWLGR